MNCFVASAFDHDDVDAIYDVAIRPVLRELKLRALRVDRIEHNEDIDDRIFRLIDQSQICIADLTHARPSVYYEAGYAFGCDKPVIYIARSDHFRAREDDEVGSLRVHFDLQMKNIIPWTKPNETFKKRLLSRLMHVLKPMLHARQVKVKELEYEKAFKVLSQKEKIRALHNKTKNILRSRGYSCALPARAQFYGPPHLHVEKARDETFREIRVFVTPTVKKTDMEQFPFLWTRLMAKEYQAIKHIESAFIIVSLRTSRPAALTNIFADWTPVDDRTFTQDYSGDPPHKGTVMVLDNVRSIEHFAASLRDVMGKWGAN